MKLDFLNKLNPFRRKYEKLEVYLIAADNPVGSKQLRPIFKRKRSGEVLTREQVAAIKCGRKLLRKEMKEQGLKRRIDFEVTATNMGLYFDRNKFLWPFFLWLIRDHTVLKVLATTAVLTTAVNVSVPVIEQVIEYLDKIITEYVQEIVTETVTEEVEKEVDRFTISLSDELFNSGFVLSESIKFEETSSQLVAIPSTGVPCISIRDIPKDVNDGEGKYPDDTFFAYTFYCRYESTTETPVDYHWAVNIVEETEVPIVDKETGEQTDTRYTSDAIWVMIFEDNKMTFYAKLGEDGLLESIPAKDVDDLGYENAPLKDFAKNPELQYELMKEGEYFDYYRINPTNFLTDKIVAEGIMVGVEPFDMEKFDPNAPYDPQNPNGIHKYTVVIWLEGDDPECTNDLIGGKIGLNFRIQLEKEFIENGGFTEDENGNEGGTTPPENETPAGGA